MTAPALGDLVEVHAPKIEHGRMFDEWVVVKVTGVEPEAATIRARVPGCSTRWFAPGQWRYAPQKGIRK